MGPDHNVYVENIFDFSAEQCEEYLASLGISAEIHPTFNITCINGFVPFKLKFGNPSRNFLSGFELYLSTYTHEFYDDCSYNEELSRAKYDIMIVGHDDDSFERLMIYSFSAYLCKYCRGLFFDCYSGEYKNVAHLENEIQSILKALNSPNQRLMTHPFVKW